jgi:hypothetical protein
MIEIYDRKIKVFKGKLLKEIHKIYLKIIKIKEILILVLSYPTLKILLIS